MTTDLPYTSILTSATAMKDHCLAAPEAIQDPPYPVVSTRHDHLQGLPVQVLPVTA